jgi:hypothetical protein
MSAGFEFNGANFDRRYNNTQGMLLASAARTASITSPSITNYNAKGLLVFLSVEAASGTGGLQIVVLAINPGSGGWDGITTPTSPITGTGEFVWIIYPGATTAVNDVKGASSVPIPREWAVAVVVGDSSSYTYSLSYSLIN